MMIHPIQLDFPPISGFPSNFTLIQARFKRHFFSNNPFLLFDLQEAYNGLSTEQKVTLLIRAIQNPHEVEDNQIMATVLLRRVFSSDFQDFFPKVRFKHSYHSALI